MKKSTLLIAAAIITIAPQTANAQDWLNRINNAMNQVDQTLSTVDRAQSTTNKVMDKVPEKSANDAAAVEPASGNTQALTAQEKMILKKAHFSNDPDIKRQAEEIMSRF